MTLIIRAVGGWCMHEGVGVRLFAEQILAYITTIGHGKLFLGDGGYFEGTLAYGEIEGHGYRVFGLTGATYSGQFHRGEMHGQGIFQYPNGEVYEGSWAKGRKEGELFLGSYV